MATVPTIPLNTGASIPQLGLGTWPLDDAAVARAIVAAAELGYRHIDTAVRYGNEPGVGEGVRRTGIPRGEFFVTTKLDGPFQGDDKAIGGLEAALDRMGFDYVDLLLIHWPLPARDQYVATWKTFEKLYADGRARAIGVSNFKIAHLERLAEEAGIVPAVNQVQLNPQVTRPAQRAYHREHGIVTVSYSPLGGSGPSGGSGPLGGSGPAGGSGARLLSEPVYAEIGERYGKTAAQVVLRWHVQQGLVAIPKSGDPDRMRQNLGIFDFELAGDDMARIAELAHGPDAGNDSDRTGH